MNRKPYKSRDAHTTVSVRSVRTQTDIAGDQQIGEQRADFPHAQHCRRLVRVCPRASVILPVEQVVIYNGL